MMSKSNRGYPASFSGGNFAFLPWREGLKEGDEIGSIDSTLAFQINEKSITHPPQ